jgi:hypothetical protein
MANTCAAADFDKLSSTTLTRSPRQSNMHGVSGCVWLRHLVVTRIDDKGDADCSAVTDKVSRCGIA